MVIILPNTVEPPGATTSRRQSTTAPQQPVFQDTKPFQSLSNHYIWNLL